ncbi:MAG: glycoside hydrolase family 88 protein [Paludibacter sp.]|jgi:rhamnogalacturonyl hydrolase YesR|nr:glycoside hydrolase family 88 protein [Paludibacter sp.]
MKTNLLTIGLGLLLLSACNSTSKNVQTDLIADNVAFAEKQIGHQVKLIEESGKILNPRTVKNDKIQYVPIDDWTSGFFPGSMWYMYELTGNEKWKNLGTKYTEDLDSVKFLTWHHDVGFMINTSYGNAYKATKNEAYKDVMIQAAKSLATRFRPTPGVIQSWDEDRGWQGTRGWMCPVIIDNMMNLELFFEVTRFTGDSSFYKMAVSHADVTLENHFRDDYSCYHVIDYDKIKGGVRHKHTAQGYAHESAWARGQAWAIYGFAVCYRETKDPRYLELTDKIYNYLFTHKNMPEDLVPYWDFDAPNIPNEPRDASAAAIIASALYELSTFGKPEYKETADKIVASLSSPAYRALLGTNGNFLLMHSVGSIPHGHEIDVPLNYADYYFLEALLRKKGIEKP